MVTARRQADSVDVQDSVELRGHVARYLHARAERIVKDSMAIYAFAGMENVSPEGRSRLASLILQIMTIAVRDGAVESRSPGVVELGQQAVANALGSRTQFRVVYLMERSALDELALDESFGATSEPWPSIAQMMRRASFDVCAALAESQSGNTGTGIIDALTTLHTEPVFLAAVDKEIQRSERFGHPFALIMLDVDHLADINAKQGYGAGDRVIERVGIVVRGYFRETDWVARSGGGAFTVLLPEITRTNAERLADRIRITVEERLELHDYKSEEHFSVTVSVGVVVAESIERTARAAQLMAQAKQAVERAKQAGRNRVESVVASSSP